MRIKKDIAGKIVAYLQQNGPSQIGPLDGADFFKCNKESYREAVEKLIGKGIVKILPVNLSFKRVTPTIDVSPEFKEGDSWRITFGQDNLTHKDFATKLVEYFRGHNNQILKGGQELYRKLGCTQAAFSYNLRKLLSCGILEITSGEYGRGGSKAVFKIKDEYLTGESWQQVFSESRIVSGITGKNKDSAGQVVEYFRNHPSSPLPPSSQFGFSQASLSGSVTKLLNCGVLEITSGEYGRGKKGATFRICNEFSVGDSWRQFFRNAKTNDSENTSSIKVNSDDSLAMINQQIKVERERIASLEERRRTIEGLLAEKNRIQVEIQELHRQSGLKLNRIRQIDKQILAASSDTKSTVQAVVANKSVNGNHDGNIVEEQETEPPVEITKFDEHMADYERACAVGAKALPISREGYVGTPTDLAH